MRQDHQGMTGKYKVEYHSIPYKSVTHFSVETTGHFDLDSELKIWVRGILIQREFEKGTDIRAKASPKPWPTMSLGLASSPSYQNLSAMDKNTDLTKLARWVIPGWITFFAFYLFTFTDLIVCLRLKSIGLPHPACLYPTIQDALRVLVSDWKLLALLFTTISVPLGFFIYQAYFFLRWNSPVSRDGFSALIAGRMQDLQQLLRDIGDDLLLLDKAPWRKAWLEHPLYDIAHSFKAQYLEGLQLEAASERFYHRVNYLHEIVHTLGASIGSTFLAFLLYLIFKFIHGVATLPMTYIAAFLGLTFLLATALELETRELDQARLKSQFTPKEKAELVQKLKPLTFIRIKERNLSYPSAFLMTVGAYILFAADPIFFSSHNLTKSCIIKGPSALTKVGDFYVADTALRMAILVFVALAWAWGASSDEGNERLDDKQFSKKDWRSRLKSLLSLKGKKIPPDRLTQSLVALLLAILIYILPCGVPIPSPKVHLIVDWPFLSALYLFLTFFFLLYRNRYNAKNELLSLRYYLLQQYFTK